MRAESCNPLLAHKPRKSKWRCTDGEDLFACVRLRFLWFRCLALQLNMTELEDWSYEQGLNATTRRTQGKQMAQALRVCIRVCLCTCIYVGSCVALAVVLWLMMRLVRLWSANAAEFQRSDTNGDGFVSLSEYLQDEDTMAWNSGEASVEAASASEAGTEGEWPPTAKELQQS